MRSRWPGFQSVLADPIERFLAHKRSLGRRYDNEEKALRLLDRFLLDRAVSEAGAVTAEFLDEFLASRHRAKPRSYNHLLGVVRRLFNWMLRQGLLERSPLHDVKRRETARRIPYLLTIPEVRRLLAMARSLPDSSNARRRGPTYRGIFALLYGLGLRVGEVCRLQWQDVDLERNLLIVRGAKFGKDRLVPFGPRMRDLIQGYHALQRPHALQDPVFSFTPGRPIHPGTVSQLFHHLVPHLGLTLPAGVNPPRVHDLRHAFAVGTLLRWYRSGIDPATRLFHLSTFLGHVNPSSTSVYLTVTSELLCEANSRFERFGLALVGEVSP